LIVSKRFLVRRDTNSWVMQVWLSFILAFMSCAAGVWSMPGQDGDRAFLTMALLFCLTASFTLAKTIRDNRDEARDSPQWVFMAWAGFAAAIASTAWGLYRMAVDAWARGALIIGCLFLISTIFSLAKTIRDQQEANQIESVPSTDEV